MLEGQVAWITGAGSGIGRASAIALAKAGASVALSGRREALLGEVESEVAALGGRAIVVPIDVSSSDAVRRAVDQIRDRLGAVQIVVNSAGTNVVPRRLGDVGADAWRRVVDVNLNGAFNVVAATLPDMRSRGQGTFVNIASWAAVFDVTVSGAAYSASKRGLVALSNAINLEEAQNGIRSCVICPAETATEMLRSRPVPPTDEELARMLHPEDLGATVRFVCELPPRACVNQIVISPTWNRLYMGR